MSEETPTTPAADAGSSSSSEPSVSDVLHDAQGPAADPAYTGSGADAGSSSGDRRAELERELADLDKADADTAAAAEIDRQNLVPGTPEHRQAVAADPAAFGQSHSSGSLEHPDTTPPSELESGSEPAQG